MKFILETVINCEMTFKMMHHEVFEHVLNQEFNQMLKLCCSSFFCLCWFVDKPSSSLLIHFHEQLGIPPNQLEASNNGEPVFYVISLVNQNEKIPLLFCEHFQIAILLLDELLQIYCFETISFKTNSVTLDNKARLWHQVFNLPAISKSTALQKKQEYLYADEQLNVHSLSNDLSQ